MLWFVKVCKGASFYPRRKRWQGRDLGQRKFWRVKGQIFLRLFPLQIIFLSSSHLEKNQFSCTRHGGQPTLVWSAPFFVDREVMVTFFVRGLSIVWRFVAFLQCDSSTDSVACVMYVCCVSDCRHAVNRYRIYREK